MSDMHMREKVRKVTEAAKQSDHVPEQTKKAGFMLFILFSTIGILLLFALTTGFIMNDNLIAAILTGLIALFLVYCVYKLLTTDDIPHL